MNNKIILIQSHCNTEEKKNYLLNNINRLKEYDVDILLFSHIPLPNDITAQVDYFIYDKSNPILSSERQHYYWWANDNLRLETTMPDYGWTVFNQIIKSYSLIERLKYEYIYIFCYDVIIDDTVDYFLKNPQSSVFTHLKSEDVDSEGNFLPVRFETALVFSILKNEEMKILIGSISKEEYVNKTDLIAEKYFEVKLQENNIYHKNQNYIRDFFSQGNDIFNLTKEKEYHLFVDNLDLLKFRIIKNSNKMNVVINSTIIEVDSNYFVFDEKINNLKMFGCFYQGTFDNWLPYISENRVNKITIK